MGETNKGGTFLVVDSQLSNLNSLSSLLQNMGHEFTLQAEDGAEAWSMFQNFQVDFVVCENEIPEMNGLVLLKTIRANEEFSTTPFLLIAGNVTRQLVMQAGRCGVTDILVKPFNSDQFRKKLEAILSIKNDPKFVEAEANYSEGLELMKQGRFDEAMVSFKRILTAHEDPEVYFNLGYIHSMKSEFEEALRCFYRATQINSQYAAAHSKIAEICIKLGRQQEAEEHLNIAGNIYLEKKQDREAEDIFNLLSKVNPETSNVYNSLGIIYRRNKRIDDAIRMYVKALKVDPDNENIYFNLARVFLDKKDVSSARTAIQKSLAINKDFAPAKELAKALEMGLSFNF